MGCTLAKLGLVHMERENVELLLLMLLESLQLLELLLYL